MKQKTARTILLTVMLLVFYRRCSERGSYITLCRDYSRRGRIRSLILINVNSENGFSRVYLILITSRRSRKFSLFHFDKNISMIAPDHAHVSMFENAVEKIRALHAPSFYPLNLTRRSYELRISPVHSPSRLKYTFYELYFMNLSKCLLTMVSLARPEQFSIRSEKGNFEKERESRATSPRACSILRIRIHGRGVIFVSRSELAILSDDNTRKKLMARICRMPQRS